MKNLTAFLCLIILIFSHCKNGETKNKESQTKEKFKTEKWTGGTVIPKLQTLADASQSYAIYLPTTYNNIKTLPVLFLFDSHAKGKTVVEKYKDLCEKFKYIVAVSNNSQNGLSQDVYPSIIDDFFKDVRSRFKIDSMRIYAGGFSGGARVASMAAFANYSVSALIGSGAGFSGMPQNFPPNLMYIGLVGNKDFNFLEFLNINAYLDKINVPHQLIIFDGKHEWPTPEKLLEVFYALEFSAMRSKIIPSNHAMINEYLEIENKAIEKFSQQKLLTDKLDLLKRVVTNLDGLTDLFKYNQQIASLEKSKEILKENEEFMQSMGIEQNMMQNYQTAFGSQNLQWWQGEIKNLQQTIKQSTNRSKKLSNQRMLNYLSMLAYMYTSGAIKNNQQADIEKYLTIYKLVDPENADLDYFTACNFVKLNQLDKAMESIESAFKHGFTDIDTFENDPIFEPLKSNGHFKELIEKKRQEK